MTVSVQRAKFMPISITSFFCGKFHPPPPGVLLHFGFHYHFDIFGARTLPGTKIENDVIKIYFAKLDKLLFSNSFFPFFQMFFYFHFSLLRFAGFYHFFPFLKNERLSNFKINSHSELNWNWNYLFLLSSYEINRFRF